MQIFITATITILLAFSVTSKASQKHQSQEEQSWLHYGGSLAGDRYVAPSAISPETIHTLSPAWEFRTGDATSSTKYGGRSSKFRATPILLDNKLIFSTGFNRVFAINPETGKQVWTFDPKVDFSRGYSEMFTSRGVAGRKNLSQHGNQICSAQVFLGTLDARLIALDARTGQKCPYFGDDGEVDLSKGIRNYRRWDYSVTSPPIVVGDLVVVGSAIGDNGATELESGIVRAYHATSGNLVWSWDPIPRSADHPSVTSWTDGANSKTGGGNVWSVMSADAERDIIYLPTTSPSPDFYGGKRLGDNAYANSIVALRASTGQFLWGYQTVRHDLWDFDLASQPLLFDYIRANGQTRPALAQATKMGFIFVLDRETGEPLHEIQERPVPQTDIIGEQTAPTQRFPAIQLHTTDARPLHLWNNGPNHAAVCAKLLNGVRYEGIFTPPSLEGTLLYPGNGGGTNWGSMAYNPQTKIGYLTVNRLPTIVKLIPRTEFRAAKRRGTLNGLPAQHTAQNGAPFGMARVDVYNPENSLPCLEGPWASVVAVDLNQGAILWEKPVGGVPDISNDARANEWGFYASGGPLVTAGNIVIIATPFDQKLRAHNGTTGEMVWQADLPAGAHATPMSYRYKGQDYIVVTAGGRIRDSKQRGDFVIAYKLNK